MLAELAAFNAGLAVIKTTISSGKDISNAIGSLANMVGAEEQLRARGNRKKKSIWSKLAGKSSDDFDEFMGLQQIKQQRAELKSIIQIYANFTWEDFLAFEAKMRKKRKEEAEERERQIAQNMRYLTYALAMMLSIAGLYALYMFTDFLKDL